MPPASSYDGLVDVWVAMRGSGMVLYLLLCVPALFLSFSLCCCCPPDARSPPSEMFGGGEEESVACCVV